MKIISSLMVVVALKATVFLLSIRTNTAETVHSKESEHIRRVRETEMGLTRTVNHAFCDSSLSDEDKVTKKTLKEIHTCAELKSDPQGNLPDSFTVCSSMMTPSCPSLMWPPFFTILDTNKAQFFTSYIRHRDIASLLKILFQETSKSVVGKIPPLFPNCSAMKCAGVNLGALPLECITLRSIQALNMDTSAQ